MASDGLTLKIYSVSFFGHRVVNTPRQIEQKLDKLIRSLLSLEGMENLISLRPPQYDGLSGHFGMTTAPMFWCCRIPLRNTGIMRIAFVIIMMKLKSVKTLPRHTTSLQFRYATGK